MTRKAIPIEDLTEEEIAMIAAAEVDADMVEMYAALMDVDVEDNTTIHRGTSCLWTDLGYPSPAEMRLAALLSNEIESCASASLLSLRCPHFFGRLVFDLYGGRASLRRRVPCA